MIYIVVGSDGEDTEIAAVFDKEDVAWDYATLLETEGIIDEDDEEKQAEEEPCEFSEMEYWVEEFKLLSTKNAAKVKKVR